MEIRYKVYKRNEDDMPVLSLTDLPEIQMKSKKKYTGKKAKIEAILRFSGRQLSPTLTTQQVNDFVGINIFGTSKWNEYHSILNKVLDERIPEVDKYIYLYDIKVVLKTQIDSSDDRLIYLVTCELIGKPIEAYKSLRNPIIKIEKT